MTLEEAILEAGKEAPPVPKKGTGKGSKAKAAARTIGEAQLDEASMKDLGDDEWLATVCGPIWSVLKKKSQFRRDALLYRHTHDLRRKIQKGLKEALKGRKSDGLSPFYNVLYRVFFTKHPSLWKVCGACAGTGKDKETGEECPTCRGAAFKMEVEYI